MRRIAALSCRLPDLVSLTLPLVLPDQTGIKAIPACRANAASGLVTRRDYVERPVPQLATRLVDRDNGVGPLVYISSNNIHGRLPPSLSCEE